MRIARVLFLAAASVVFFLAFSHKLRCLSLPHR
jgi:hypothetical protein